MSNFIGTLRHSLDGGGKIQLIWCGAIMLTMLILAILHHKWRFYEQKLKKWQDLCFIPLLITIVHYFIYVRGASLLNVYTPLYLIAVLALLLMPVANMRKGYRIVGSVAGVLTLVFGIFFCAIPKNTCNLARKSYSESFHALAQEMDRSYVLKEWKDVDFSALENKYMPMVKEAEQEKDPGKFADAVEMFCNELHDGHIMVQRNYDTEKYPSVFELREYGLAMIGLDSGEVIAVCTTDEVNRLGIEDGTVITKWNGKPVQQAAAEDVLDRGEPVKSNADKVSAMYLSGTGGDTVQITFLDKSGKEQTAVLSDLGENNTFYEAYDAFTQIQKTEQPNFSTKMLNDKCGYIVMNAQTSGGPRDLVSDFSSRSDYMKKEFRKKLSSLKEQGMEYLVVDLRDNMGGCDAPTVSFCELLTNEKYFTHGLGVYRGGKYICAAERYIRGTGEFADLKVVALTNLECISAGDAASLYLSKLPNVTLAGITDPSGSGQETGGCCVLSDSVVGVLYPTGLLLGEDGVPYIDTRADRVSRDPVEVRIPFDYDAAMKIFRDGEDYELEWAVNYLSEQ